ncbi:hypothetical protein GFS24_15060 [Chitinophaga sp. SYP-B3965]|uniref:MBG domain-containing protein n=1 Tax=Chitinophaga sp. SYP-B3965 TaxID=2663120 RepID=UPI0012999115|nr:MBG domain-containing protein [Chitinophaga sp. SYP-B3965]MRG46440.1 hypothetical protein [Chitinophaga sp. SYP-B3965]
MNRFILFLICISTTSLKAQQFTEVDQLSAPLPGIWESSAVWGDYDNDGDLDILLTGNPSGTSYSYATQIWRNKGDGTFENSGIILNNLSDVSAAWGDYDNDGDLDILLMGGSNLGAVSKVYRNKGNGTFEDSGISLPAMLQGSVAWGDYDNDGDLDILLTGFYYPGTGYGYDSKLYRNKGNGTFENSGVTLPFISNFTGGNSSVGWADYDNDGDLDFLLSDFSNGGKLYRNKGDGTFEDGGVSLPALYASSLGWADYDNDGNLDFIIAGTGNGAYFNKLYHNKGDGTFEDSNTPLPGLYELSIAWGDYDNDGDPDILISGAYGSAGTCKIYRNKGDGTFEDSGISLNGLHQGSVAWGDYDNDGDLDILQTGMYYDGGGAINPLTRIYRNNAITPNTKPTSPTGLQVVLSPNGKSATLSWQKATDAQTPQNGLSYNVYVSETPAGGNRQSSMSNTTNGFRKIAAVGNTGSLGRDTIKGLTPGKKYYWSVQAVDAAFAGSAFAAEQEFTTPLFEKLPFASVPLGPGTYHWGDLDNDGDLDAFVVHDTFGNKVYLNKGDGTFDSRTMVYAPLQDGVAALGDYDNDGYLDILLTGGISFVYHNKGDGTFEDAGIPLPTLYLGTVAWCDYDNDGDQDITLTGSLSPGGGAAICKIYRNKGDGTFEDSGIPLTGAYDATLIWEDFDNDGDQDLISTGTNSSGQMAHRMYWNNGNGTFQSTSGISMIPSSPSAASGDYDNDGDQDLLITGVGTNPKILRNAGDGNLYETTLPFAPLRNNGKNGSASFGDYDNDGYLDILMAGFANSSSTSFTTKIYHNKGDGTFEEAAAITPTEAGTRTFWVDYDNDNDLDLVITGTASSNAYAVYKNNTGTPNTKPTAPAGLQVTLSADSKSAVLTWQKATDGQTAQNGLNYNVYISQTPGAVTRQSPLSNTSNGFRRVVATGNTGSLNRDTIKGLELSTTYYWSVQAIDAAHAGSPFATERSFTTKAPQTISFINITATYGDADITPAATASSSLPVTFSSDNASVATIVGGKIHITGTGTANIKASQVGSSAYIAAPDITVTLTVSKKQLTVTAANKTITYGDALPVLTYTISGLVTPETQSVFTTPVNITTDATSDAGTYNITATGAVAANYDFTYLPGTLTIQKAPTQISFSSLPVKTYGDADFALAATITNGQQTNYTTSDANVAAITGSNIRITGAGTATITAKYPGDQNHLPATDVPVTLTVSKKQLTVTAQNKTITYGDALPPLTYTIAGLIPTETESVFTTGISISTTATASSNVGVYDIDAASAAAANYDFIYQRGTLTIQKATANISFTTLPVKTYGDADFAAGATIPNGLPITYTSTGVATIVNGNIHITGAGTATITAHQVGNGNYDPAADVPVMLTVSKKQLTVTAANKTITYGDPLPVLTYDVTGFITGETESVFSQPVNITTDATGDAGIFSITASNAAAANYDFTYQGATLTIQKASVNIIFNAQQATYGDADFDPGATISNGLPITYTSSDNTVATIINNNIHITGAGTTTITAKQPGNSNYNAATDVPVTLTVNKKQLTVTAEDKSITYGDALPTFTYTIAGLTNGDTEAAFTTPVNITGTGTNAGTYPITATNASADNYNFVYQAGTLTIQKATASIIFNAQQATYGDADLNPGATIANGLPITYTSANSNVATIVNGNIHITGAGTATITAHQAGNGNYNAATDVSVTLTVNKKQLTVTAADKTKAYGKPNPVLTYTITGFENGETESVFNTPVIITTPANDASNTGTYPITPANATANNYLFIYTDGVLSINKAPSTISFVTLPTKTYGDGDFNPGASISNGLSITYTSTGVATIINNNIHITGAGTAMITAKQAGDNNYEAAADVSVILTVSKKTLTIKANDQTKVYGEPNPAFTYTITGLVNPDTEAAFTFPLYITSTGINAGTYPITASNAAAENYDFIYQSGTLIIQKAAQTITFNALPNKTYGDADFNPNATSSSGLPITYTSSNNNVANGNIHITGAGTATITATQPGNNNYNAATPATQQLIVNKATQTITFSSMATRTTGGPAFDPGATASSGLPITYQIENVSIASLAANRITATRPGFTKVTATQPGNNNYEPAAAITQELEIVTGNTIKIQDAVTPNGDGINDYLLIEGIRQFPDNELYISNASGKIVFQAKGYNNTNNTFRGFAGSGTTLLTRGVYYYVLLYQGKKLSGFFVLEY